MNKRKSRKRSPKTLPEFIAAVGDEIAAEMFGIEKVTARAYRLRNRIPQHKNAVEIVEKTALHPDGPVTFDGIYADVQPVKFKEREK